MIAFLVFISCIPIATAPVWYGSGDDTGLVGKWSCEGNFKDSSGQGNHGTQSGGVTITSGVKGRACGFDGIDAYITGNGANLPNVGNAGNATIIAWVKPNTANERTIFNKGSNGACFNYGMTLTSGVLKARVNSDYTLGGNLSNSLDVWTHLAIVYNASGAYGYVNGAFVGNHSSATTTTCATLNWVIGTRAYNSITEMWNGSIDEVRIYNRSLSASEISSLYNTSKTYHVRVKTTPTQGGLNDTPAPTLSDETGLVGWWKMDGDATDSSGQGNTGTISVATNTSSGRWSGAYNLDAGNPYIALSNTEVLNSTTTNRTVAAWVKPNNCGESVGVQCRIWSGTSGDGLLSMYQYYNTNYLYCTLKNSTGSYRTSVSLAPLPLGVWSFGTCTYNYNSVCTWVNGIMQGCDVVNTYPSPATGPFYIGTHTGSSSYNFNGTIDEVRVYNRSLSDSEIKELYLSKGLVGYWKMDADQKNSTSTFDSSGYYNHGLISGATLTNEGRFKEGYKFDGVDDFINLSRPTAFQFGTSDMTMSLWVYLKNVSTTRVIFGVFNGTGGSNATEIGVISQKFAALFGASAADINDGATVSINKWYHVVQVKNGDNGYLYINGAPDGTTKTGLSARNLTHNADWCIGRQCKGTSFWVDGYIDEVRIYNRALTAEEVAGLYNGTKSYHIEIKTTPTLGGLNDTPAPTATDETGLVGYWKMDDLTNGNTTDSSGQGNSGVVTGATFNSGRWNKGYSFDGSNDYIYAVNSPSFNSFGVNPFTISAWFKTSSLGYSTIIDNKYAGTNNAGYNFFINTGSSQITFRIANGTTADNTGGSTANINDNKWHFVTGTKNNTGIYMYIDGVIDKTSVASVYSTYNVTNTQALYFGAYAGVAGNGNFNGTIDEVRIYNRSLSADEVKELYLSKGLVGYWKMDADQKNSTSTFDSSGYYNHGLITGAALTGEGRFKEGYKFDGVNDYIDMGDDRDLEFINASFSTSAWVKVAGGQGTFRTILSDYITPGEGGYDLYADSSNQYGVYFRNSTSISNIAASAVTLNSWAHVATSYNRTHAFLCVNGICTSPTAVLDMNIGNTKNFLIGARHAGSVELYFNGTIDEVRIYNRALTAEEVAGLYNGTQTYHWRIKTVPG